MAYENISTLAASMSGSGEGKRNKKAQFLSALLSASALGVFLEGCGEVLLSISDPFPYPPDIPNFDNLSGSENNPYSTTSAANSFTGSYNRDWVSYAESNEGVTIDLSTDPATVSGGWANGDTLRDIYNLIGSDHADTLTGGYRSNSFEGGRGDDVLAGGRYRNTYAFNAGDGTDTINDHGGNIVFKQGSNNDYAGATYTFVRADGGGSDTVTLTVAKDGSTLNVIKFTTYPSSSFNFYTRSSDGSETEISASSLVFLGSERKPYLATAAADSFTGSEDYDWVSYAGSTSGVNVNLNDNSANSGDWAAGDSLTGINNLMGSNHDDTLTGDRNANSFEGGRGNDVLAGRTYYRDYNTYVFNKGDGTDTIIDSDGKIVFKQGANNDYAGATYSFAYIERSSDVRLTVTKDGNTLNIIDFPQYPSGFSFYTRSSDGSETEIPDSSLVIPPRRGSESNPFLATSAADAFTGSGIYDWVSYAGSNEGVTIDLNDNPAGVSGGWADGDTLRYIDNLIGSEHADTLTGDNGRNSFEGGRGNDVLAGGGYTDTYAFNAGDGTDTIIDSDSKIVFKQGANNDYAGATYSFAYIERSSDVRLTVTKDGNTLNIIDFPQYPSGFNFYTRSSDGSETEILDSLLVIPPRRGGESNPYLATDTADSFTGSRSYDWVSYAGSNEGVTIDLNGNPAGVSGGWANGDTLTNIDNLIGSEHADTLTGDNGRNSFEGGRGNDVLAGGRYTDTYAFNAGDGTDTIIDNRGNIVFKQGANNDYTGATYTFEYVSADSIRLTVAKDGNTLNIIDFSQHPSDFNFYTRSSDGSETEIPDSSLALPGSEYAPYLATSAADTFTGSGVSDWVSYAGSTSGVNVNLNTNPVGVSVDWAAGDTLRYIDNLIGSDHVDTLSGDHDENILRGGRGNDIINGGRGSDTLNGEVGNDRLRGGFGDDDLYGGSGADTYEFGYEHGNDVIRRGAIDGIGNKLIFEKPDPAITYYHEDAPLEMYEFSHQIFRFTRGNLVGRGFTASQTGDDLKIVVTASYQLGSNSIIQNSNDVTIEDYFDLSDNAYTIYNTDYGSNADGTIVSTQPAETS